MGNVKKTVGLVCLAALCVLMIVLGVRTAGYVQLTREEAATTPTAEPVGGNVMVVTPDPNAPTAEPVLKNGAQGDDVTNLQSRLKTLGYYSGEIDGQFGNATREAVMLFQYQNGLDTDGVVGSETRALLFRLMPRCLSQRRPLRRRIPPFRWPISLGTCMECPCWSTRSIRCPTAINVPSWSI